MNKAATVAAAALEKETEEMQPPLMAVPFLRLCITKENLKISLRKLQNLSKSKPVTISKEDDLLVDSCVAPWLSTEGSK
ncbi:hypothetical protein ACOSP7_022090 [Xanthoceras sorbifolium]